MENKECLFYIDHNPPECSGTWGGAIHKGACKLNTTDCKDTDGCFIKNLYNKLKIKEQEIKLAKEMLIQNDYTTNKKTLSQIIEGFMSDNLLDAQNDEGYTIPVFIQVENKLETLEDLEQECEELKKENLNLKSTQYHLKNEIKKYKKAVHKYKVILQERIDGLHLSRRELLRELNSIPKKIACTSEVLKVPLEKFNNAIQVINNEDRYKKALDEIEKIAKVNYCQDNWETLIMKINKIQDIIKTKE